ncbi:hypothetical protein CRE_18775 [Caenorhabditis remanei]|uniref:Acyltransferase 3 domain-containing protein n=1 Tax=Caenorhabditis remanei TaxID=31234 RepID=E3LK55_CAERE|nr:hypothetical protein CRE_18775 [Caenorhabditis remanei]
MCWVVTGHSFLYLALGDTLKPALDFPNHIWNHLLLSGFVSVDTFFVLSGIVVAYMFFKTKPSKKMISNPITWVLFYVHRYLRLTPPMMLFIGFFTVYAPYIQGAFSASQLNVILPQANLCKTYWWHNLLYFNNFDKTTETNSETCYNITWYLAVDTQLYLIAPIVLIALYFSFAAGSATVVTGCVGSIITTYILYGDYNLTADGFGNGNGNDFNRIVYSKPWIRCPPYLVGLLTGYLLAIYGNRKIRLNWVLCICGWMLAFVIAGFCLFSTFDYDKGTHWNVFTRATFYNFDRLGWAFFICWVVGANHMGWGGPINNFMSHPIWQPFGRLSYCAYIVHWMVLYYYLNVGGPLHFYSTWEHVGILSLVYSITIDHLAEVLTEVLIKFLGRIFHNCISNSNFSSIRNFQFLYVSVPATLLAYVLAFFWSCLFEIPTLKLEKMLIESLIGGVGRTSLKVENNGKPSGTESPILTKKEAESPVWGIPIEESNREAEKTTTFK